jgi:hypothetical protein
MTEFNHLTFALVDNLVDWSRPNVHTYGADAADGMNELVHTLLETVVGPDINAQESNYGLACIAAAAIRQLADSDNI